MKLNPMSSKIAATAILLATTGATLGVTPAYAAEETVPAPVIQTIDDQYELSSFKAPVFKAPKVVSWAVAYTPTTVTAELDPAEKALLTEDAQLAQKQKTVIEKEAAAQRAEQERIAAAKAKAEKAEADRVAAEKAKAAQIAAEKAAAEKAAQEAAEAKAAAEKAEAERVATVKAQEEAKVTAQRAAAQASTAAQNNYASTPQSGPSSSASKVSIPSSSSKYGAALAAAAYTQIGIHQDCTAMVENALRSIGKKNVGDLAPLDFYRYGTVVTDPQPGDLMITPGHVAIYVGNGMAISGGFEGLNTVLHPAKYLAGSTYVRVS